MKTDHAPDNNQDTPFASGFNMISLAAALFIGFVMLPATAYMSLITGGGIGGAAHWVTIILFIEVAKRSFVKLRVQELVIIGAVVSGTITSGLVVGTGMTLSGGTFSSNIWYQYFVDSPYAHGFGISELIPSWVVPPAGSEALIRRTFFHRDWLVPLLVLVIHEILFRLNGFTLGYVFFRVTSDYDRLEFPMARVDAEGAWALADYAQGRDTDRWRYFTVGGLMGLVYGAIYAAVPTISGLVMVRPLQLIPIPFVDFTSRIGQVFPAATLGFMTNPALIFIGMVLPFWVVIGSFTGALGTNIANPLLYRRTDLLQTWRPGMSVIPTQVANTIDFWLSVIIGLSLVIFVLSIGSVIGRNLRQRRLRPLAAVPPPPRELPPGRGDHKLALHLGIWFASTVAYLVLCKTLVPRFPTWIFAIWGFVLTPILTYISARMFGITGVATRISFPYLREGTYILSGYRGADIWFAPAPFFNHGNRAQEFKSLELTRTSFTSRYKAEMLSLSIMLVCSFIFWSFIWRMAPIPSSTYPFVQRMWPMFAITQSLWVSTTVEGGPTHMLEAIKLPVIAGGFTGGLGLAGLVVICRLPISFFYGMVGGMGTMIHDNIPMITGALLGRFFFAPRIGRERWRRATPLLTAGFGCGMGLVGAFAVAVALVARTIFQVIY